MQPELVKKGAVEVKPNLMFIEPRASKMFDIWAGVIVTKNNRRIWLSVFKFYLIFALFIVSPIVLAINIIFFRPFSQKKIAQKQQYY